MGIALSLVRRSHSLYCRRRQLYSASAAAPMSLRPDPLLGISPGVAGNCWRWRNCVCCRCARCTVSIVQVTVVTILSMNILLYRIGLMIIGYKGLQ